jgi:hypothetical protein
LLKTELSVANRKDGVPEIGDPFHDPIAGQKWAEFHKATTAEIHNPVQRIVNMHQSERVWYYLGKTSTEARAQYTHEPRIHTHNPRSVFLDTVKPAPIPIAARQSSGAGYSTTPNYPLSAKVPIAQLKNSGRTEKPYVYKPKNTTQYQQLQSLYSQGLPWQNGIQALAPRPTGWSATQNSNGTESTPFQTTAGYKPLNTSQLPGMQSFFAGSQTTLSAQELLKKSIPSGIGSNSQSPSYGHKYDNSPRHENFYAEAESRYSAQTPHEYSQRYRTLTQATQPVHSTLQAHLAGPVTSYSNAHGVNSNGQSYSPTPTTSLSAAQHSAALASLRNLPTGLLPQSSGLAQMPFTPPSQRPEIQAVIPTTPTPPALMGAEKHIKRSETPLGDPSPSARSLIDPALSAVPLENGNNHRPALVHQTSSQFTQAIHQTQDAGIARFESLIKQLGAAGSMGTTNGAVTPPNGLAESVAGSSFDVKALIDRTPERPGYSPISVHGTGEDQDEDVKMG